jgi:hypothetical protein
MFRKLTLAFAAVAALGTAALAPATAQASWYGKHYGHSYWGGYSPYYAYGPGYVVYGPRFGYGPRAFHHDKFGWKRYRSHY